MKTIILGLGMVLCMLTFTGCRKQEKRVLGGWIWIVTGKQQIKIASGLLTNVNEPPKDE